MSTPVERNTIGKDASNYPLAASAQEAPLDFSTRRAWFSVPISPSKSMQKPPGGQLGVETDGSDSEDAARLQQEEAACKARQFAPVKYKVSYDFIRKARTTPTTLHNFAFTCIISTC